MVKAKNMMYVQNLEHLPFKDLTECLEHIRKELTPTKYAGILHNKDMNEDGSLKTPHIHVMLQFENARSIDNVAKILKDKPQYIQQWKGDSTNGYSYLIHATTDAQEQHQYDVNEVEASFDYKDLIEKAKKRVKFTLTGKDELIIKGLLDKLYIGGITKEEVERQLSGSQYAKAKTRIDSVYQKRMKIVADEWREYMRENNLSIEVIWIYGASGVGKTRLAKDYASKYDEDYFVTGSSRDPFQHYQGQKIIILDELRPSIFQYSDLLKMLDPFNDDVMGASRYFDKPLTANIFIITSPYKPRDFYMKIIEDNKKFDLHTDSFKQLARRINLVLYLDKDSMQIAFYDSKLDNFFLEKSSKEPNPYIEVTKDEDLLQILKSEKLYKQVLNGIKNKPDKVNNNKPKDNSQTVLF
ncbi:Rep family protein [Bacillus cereus group sp. BfR-BA-01495]|uniref:Rep family protein n=1 Tax=Bacillus cereus group sp. BfR-BA-01495 TaxID=2920363 RepID=UPI001F59E4C3|nr:Rep family protein [Bacillus cereus group sp. BfR-BA-01495]